MAPYQGEAKHRGKNWPRSAEVARPYQGAGASHASGRVTCDRYMGDIFRGISLRKVGRITNQKISQCAKKQQKRTETGKFLVIILANGFSSGMKHFRRVSSCCPERAILTKKCTVAGQSIVKDFSTTVPISTTTIPYYSVTKSPFSATYSNYSTM